MWKQAVRPVHGVEMLIIDHYLLRCEEGLSWLDRLSSEVNRRVICGEDFMDQSRHLFEARRVQLYEEMPVSEDWHEAYARRDADTQQYRNFTDG